MAFTKSDGTAGSFDENGKPVGNKNDGQSIQGVDAKLGSDSANAQDGTDTSAAASIQPVNVEHSNTPSSDNRVKKLTTGSKNTDIRKGRPAGFNSYKGTFSDEAKTRTNSLGISTIRGENVAENVGDSDGALAAPPGLERERGIRPNYQFPAPGNGSPWGRDDDSWGSYVDEWVYRVYSAPPWRLWNTPLPIPDLVDPCEESRIPSSVFPNDCYKSDLCHSTSGYCGETGVLRNIYKGKLGLYDGYWYEAGNSLPIGPNTTLLAAGANEEYYASGGCCDIAENPDNSGMDRGNTWWGSVKGFYGLDDGGATLCGMTMTGIVGGQEGWAHRLNFVNSGEYASGCGLGTYACMTRDGWPVKGNSDAFQGIFFEPNDCSGSDIADLWGCYMGVGGFVHKHDTFMVGTPDDPCFCERWRRGYGSFGAWTETHPWQGYWKLDYRRDVVHLCQGSILTRSGNRHPNIVEYKDSWQQCVWTGTCSGVDGPFVMDTGLGYSPPMPPEKDASGVLPYCTPKRYIQPTTQASAEAISCFKTACNPGSRITLPEIENNDIDVKVWNDDQFRCVDKDTHLLCEEQYIFTTREVNDANRGNGVQAIAILGCCMDTAAVPPDLGECTRLFSSDTGTSGMLPVPCHEIEGTGAWVDYTGYDGSEGTPEASGDKNWYVWDRSWSGDFQGLTGECDTGMLDGADCAFHYTLAHYDCVTDDSANYSCNPDGTCTIGSHPDIDDLQMKGVDAGTSIKLVNVERCAFDYPATLPFVDCGSCYSGVALYDTGVLVFWSGQIPPNTGRNYRIDNVNKTGSISGVEKVDCGFSYDLTYMCNGIAIGPTFSDVPETGIAPTGLTRNCLGGGGGCSGDCLYTWEENWVGGNDDGIQFVQKVYAWRGPLPPRVGGNECNCVCAPPNRNGRFPNEVVNGTCT